MLDNNKTAITYFIADLHLCENRPDISACFLRFLKNDAIEAEKLYILGDLFEAWVGDDDDSPYLSTIAKALSNLAQSGTKIFYIHGSSALII